MLIAILLGFVVLGGSCGGNAFVLLRGILNGTGGGNLKLFTWCFNGLPLVDKLPELIDNKTYLVLLQNNHELRASGGFMGSYVKLKFGNQVLKSLEVKDIYQPDGQVPAQGYVEPPAAIKEAFPYGSWKLRDSNWDVDFSVAGEQVAWFFGQGGEKADGLIAVNLSLISRWLEILDGVKVFTYDQKVTSKNLASLAQRYAEINHEKRDFLGAVGTALWERSKFANPIELIKLSSLIYKELQNKQILVWVSDKDLEKEIINRGWGGDLGSYMGNYLYFVESNLGANKANCCISRQVTQRIDNRNETLEIKYKNNNEFKDPKPPIFWGGDYHNYLRIVLPAVAQVKDADKYDIEIRDKFKIVGWWVLVPAGQEVTTKLEYDLPISKQILVKRQPGIDNFPYKLFVDGKLVIDATIGRDKEYIIRGSN